MQIEYRQETLIDNIEIGECFYYKGDLYIKINPPGILYSDAYPNAVVCFKTNDTDRFMNGVKVKKVDAKIVVDAYYKSSNS